MSNNVRMRLFLKRLTEERKGLRLSLWGRARADLMVQCHGLEGIAYLIDEHECVCSEK